MTIYQPLLGAQYSLYKPIGAAPLRHLFFGKGGILVWFNAPRATDFREKRNPPQADSIVSVL